MSAAVYGLFALGQTVLKGGSGIGSAFLGLYLGALVAKVLFPKLYPQAAGIIALTFGAAMILMVILGGVFNLALREFGISSHMTFLYGMSPVLMGATIYLSYRLCKYDFGLFGCVRWGLAALFVFIYVGGFLVDVQLNPRIEQRFTHDSIDDRVISDF